MTNRLQSTAAKSSILSKTRFFFSQKIQSSAFYHRITDSKKHNICSKETNATQQTNEETTLSSVNHLFDNQNHFKILTHKSYSASSPIEKTAMQPNQINTTPATVASENELLTGKKLFEALVKNVASVFLVILLSVFEILFMLLSVTIYLMLLAYHKFKTGSAEYFIPTEINWQNKFVNKLQLEITRQDVVYTGIWSNFYNFFNACES